MLNDKQSKDLHIGLNVEDEKRLQEYIKGTGAKKATVARMLILRGIERDILGLKDQAKGVN